MPKTPSVRSALLVRLLGLFVALTAIFAASRALAKPASSKPAPKPTPAPSAAPASPDEGEDNAEPTDDEKDDGPPLHFTDGPTTIDLGHSLTLNLPATDRFLAHDDADALLKKMGNLHNEGVLGLVAAKDRGDWFAVIDWSDEGHVNDDEKVDADELLKDLRDALNEENPERVKEGFKALSIDGFQVPPAYDKAKHHLSWALIVSDEEGKSVNFNTRILGRASYASIDLVTDPQKLEAYRGEAMTLLDATTFAKGQRYEDFDSKTDKVAEYGLAGLIAGGVGLGALKLVKIGLLAKFWNVILAALIAAKKAVVLAIAAVVGFFKKIFGGKKKEGQAAPPAA